VATISKELSVVLVLALECEIPAMVGGIGLGSDIKTKAIITGD
jgi:hypothetical protein